MIVDPLYPLLGQPLSEPSLRPAFAALGVDLARELALPAGEYRANIERLSSGVTFVFTDEAYFLGQRDRPIGQGDLFFTGIFFHVAADGCSQYAGVLPHGLQFTDTRADAERRLGPSAWHRTGTDGRIRGERWIVAGNLHLQLVYSGRGAIKLISYHAPDAPL